MRKQRYTKAMNAADNPNKTVPAPASLLEREHCLVELGTTAQTLGKTREQALKHARKCLREIAATPSESWLAPAARMARFIYTRSYEPELDINLEALEELRELSKDNLKEI